MKYNIKITKLVISIQILTIISYIFCGEIDTKSYIIDSPLKEMIWCGDSRETVLVLTETNSLYRSEDKGFNWRPLNGILTHTGVNELEDNENEV